MVSQLRTQNLTATTRLEELWNEVIEEHSVSLLCTYALNGASDHIPEALIHLHSQNIERERADEIGAVIATNCSVNDRCSRRSR